MAYGESVYGTLQYGEELRGADGPGIMPLELMNYLPEYYQNIREMHDLQSTLGDELGEARFALDDIVRQYFAHSATWGLDIWERELGLTTDPSKPIERRREQIKAKLRGVGTTTKQMTKNAAAAFSGGDVEVIDYPAEHRFVVKFIGVIGIPPNMAGFISMLEQIKPAHLDYSFEYTYTTWNMLNGLIWNDAARKTWNELKVYEGA